MERDLNSSDKARILVVENDQDHLFLATMILESFENIEMVGAKDEKAAINCLENQYLPDLILLDIFMPKRGGFTVMNILKTTPDYKEIPVLALTTTDDQAVQLNIEKAGCVDILRKPLYVGDVIRKLAPNIVSVKPDWQPKLKIKTLV